MCEDKLKNDSQFSKIDEDDQRELYLAIKQRYIDLIHVLSYDLADRTLSQLKDAYNILKEPW